MTTPITTTARDDIDVQFAAARAAIAGRAHVRNVVLTACGGSYALMLPNEHIIDSRATRLTARAINAAEFVARDSDLVDADTVVLLCSHSGTTPETVAAAEHARARGALTVALTHDTSSPLALAAEHTVAYQHGPDKRESHVAQALLLRLVAGLLEDHDTATGLTAAIDSAVDQIHGLVAAAVAQHLPAADAYGSSYKNEKLIYTMAAGSNYGNAYSFAICLLQEMQWIHSQAIHAGEYFHGPFEVTDADVPFIALLGVDETRAIEQRAVDFLVTYSERTLIIDAEEFGLDAVDASVRGAVAHLIFGPVLRTYADALADHRGHPLSVRRYMWRMDY